MFDLIMSVLLALFALLIALDAFQKWRKNKAIWLILASVTGLLSALAAFINWSNAFYGLFLTIIFYLIGRSKKN